MNIELPSQEGTHTLNSTNDKVSWVLLLLHEINLQFDWHSNTANIFFMNVKPLDCCLIDSYLKCVFNSTRCIAVKTVVTSSIFDNNHTLFHNLWILIWVNKLKQMVIGYQTKHVAWRKSSYILNRNKLHTIGVCTESTAVGSAIVHTETSSYGWQHF